MRVADCVPPGCASSVGDSAVVDLETRLPYDMGIETIPPGMSTAGTGSALQVSASGEAWPTEGHDE